MEILLSTLPLLLLIFVCAAAVPFLNKWDEKRLLKTAKKMFGLESVQLKNHGSNGLSIFSAGFVKIQVPEGVFYINDHKGSRNTPSFTVIALPVENPCEFKIVPEDSLARLGKTMGVVKELEIGRRDLDDAFLIQIEQQAIGRSLILQTEFQSALELLKNVSSLDEASGFSAGAKQISSLFKNIGPAITIRLSGPLNHATKDQIWLCFRALKLFSEAIDRCR